jgi:CRISPR-associated protein Csb2
MTTIQLTFPWGRFYATPWGINSSRLREPEWPPSPWRLLRALVSAWFRAHPGQPPSDECKKLIETMGRELPLIGTGKVSFGQTVHWQPNYEGSDKVNASYKNTRHENHFAAVPGPVFFRWPELELPPAQEALLKSLLAELSYFGRAESLCHAELADCQPGGDNGWCIPTDGRKISSTCRDVFCPTPNDFEFADLWSKCGDPSRTDLRNTPPHFGDRLLATNMKADGAEWRSYQMPEGWPAKWVVRVAKSTKPKPMPSPKPVAKTLRFSLQCRIPISPKSTVDVAERFRQTALKRFAQAQGHGTHSFALSGHPPAPDGVTGDHQHAHFQPLFDKEKGIEELVVWAPCGFTQPEIEALMKVSTVYWGASKHPIRPVLTSISDQMPSFLDAKPASTWKSLTPYVPPRHFYRGNLHGAKLKQKDSPENQLAAELALCGMTHSVVITRLPLNNVDPSVPSLSPHWDIVRAPGDNPAFEGGVSTETHATHGDFERRIGFFFQLKFDQPVTVPRPLGHSSHFGLGLFVPCAESAC